MVARTKISPALLVDDDSRSNRRDVPKLPNLESGLDRKDSFSEYSALSRSESIDGSQSSSPPRAVAPAPSGERVRSRFLNRLGIAPPSTACAVKSSLRRPRSMSRESVDESFQVSLKNEEDENKSSRFKFCRQSSSSFMSASTSSNRSDSSSPSSERFVSFAPQVTVHPIPKHTAYSSRIRQTLWTDPTEMQESAARNCIEFAAENWDWRQCAEDQDMVYYQGERIHPVHFAHEYNIRRQFCAVMSAQQRGHPPLR